MAFLTSETQIHAVPKLKHIKLVVANSFFSYIGYPHRSFIFILFTIFYFRIILRMLSRYFLKNLPLKLKMRMRMSLHGKVSPERRMAVQATRTGRKGLPQSDLRVEAHQ